MKPKVRNFNNILMQLRKLLAHPYLIAPEMEPRDVGPAEMQKNLIAASAKFVVLSLMLPKLRAAGHRVLLVCQYLLHLLIVADVDDLDSSRNSSSLST